MVPIPKRSNLCINLYTKTTWCKNGHLFIAAQEP
jgi:hypothetical protein